MTGGMGGSIETETPQWILPLLAKWRPINNFWKIFGLSFIFFNFLLVSPSVCVFLQYIPRARKTEKLMGRISGGLRLVIQYEWKQHAVYCLEQRKCDTNQQVRKRDKEKKKSKTETWLWLVYCFLFVLLLL